MADNKKQSIVMKGTVSEVLMALNILELKYGSNATLLDVISKMKENE